uniref:THAP-type domain-containing protein n=1 Tax=Oryzias latipes TaxID=8090 RepID=A0A3P9JDN7_ORYLA
MPSRCVAAGCSNTSSESVSVYKFPKQETLLKQWTKQVQRTRANWVPTASSTLCSEHFEADSAGFHLLLIHDSLKTMKTQNTEIL